MHDIRDMLRPAWGSEKWISEGWNVLTSDEKDIINLRMNELFCDGLPFELTHEKNRYIYTFSLLAQLEVLAIQIPLKFGPKMTDGESKKRMRQQLLDEIFHGLVFTKILYLLCVPYAQPPEYNPHIEELCNFLREENCPRTALMLLNLISEGWIEEVFYSIEKNGIAPKVFAVIIEDEHRHVSEADLYQAIGLPDMAVVQQKLAFLENQLLCNVFMQYKYMFSLCSLLGLEGTSDFIHSLNIKHKRQLKKIKLQPTQSWDYFMQFSQDILTKLQSYAQHQSRVVKTPMRQMLMTQWDAPTNPTMMAQFDLDVSCLDLFGKKFSRHTLTGLMMQTVSRVILSQPGFRQYLSFQTLYLSQKSYVGLVVKLPRCGDQLGTIVFSNCHELPLSQIFASIKAAVKKMVFCYQQRELLGERYPEIKSQVENITDEWCNELYEYPLTGLPYVSISNLNTYGFTHCLSPLRRNETLKFTLMDVEKKPVWDLNEKAFCARDILPISLSADHRVLDGNYQAAELFREHFQLSFQQSQHDNSEPAESEDLARFKTVIQQLKDKNPQLAYRTLYGLHTYWFVDLPVDKLLSSKQLKMAQFTHVFS